VIGSLLVPIAAVASWARTALFDTDVFVATYAPLARDPQVQAYVSDQVVGAIEQQVDIDALVADVMDGIAELVQDRPRVTLALRALQQPAAAGVHSALDRAIAEVVASDAFANVWEGALRVSHTALVRALQGDPQAALTINDQGIGLQLGPIVEQVKTNLVNRGFSLAASIPPVDRTIVLVPSSELQTVQLAYRVTVALGVWLPWVALAMLAGGVLLARRRTTALIAAAGGIVIGTGLVLISLAVGKTLVLASVPVAVMPTTVSQLLFDSVTHGLVEIATAALVLGVVIALVAWLSGPYRPIQKGRAAWAEGWESARVTAAERGMSTGKLGAWIAGRQSLVLGLIVGVAALYLLLNRPLSPGVIVGTAAVAVLIALLLDIVGRFGAVPALVGEAEPLAADPPPVADRGAPDSYDPPVL
jgi:hypothetical protein